MENKEAADIYPSLTAEHIKNPNRFYAFPILGMLIKFIILIPVYIEMIFLILAFAVLSIVNSFAVLFTGKYMDAFYQFNLGFMRLSAKVSFFLWGLTNKYPGFDFTINDTFNVDIEKPQNPNRLWAFPLLGGLAKMIILIPYFIYTSVLDYASRLGVFISFAPVLFMGKYPESTYELARDYFKLTLRSSVFMTGLSDKYPSFHISMNHKTTKIILIILAILLMIGYVFMPQSSYKSSYTDDANALYQQPLDTFETP